LLTSINPPIPFLDHFLMSISSSPYLLPYELRFSSALPGTESAVIREQLLYHHTRDPF
jgi:hypothetical protein